MQAKNLFKKAMITMCSAVMLMGINAVGVNAAQGTVGEFTVERNYKSGNVVRIISYSRNGGDIVLPEKVTIAEQEYTIESVGVGFANNVKITSVQIPEGYKTIEASVFAGCTSLTSIELPKQLSSADNNFLRGCTALASVSIADGAEKFTVSDNILYDISEDTAAIIAYPFGKTETEFTIPTEINNKTVAEIAMHLFRKNGTLKRITVPDTVTTIGGFAFNDMTAVQEIVLEHTVAPTLGSYVFAGLPLGSKIIVKNDDVANKITSGSNFYTPTNTTITVAGSEPETKTVSATFSIAAEPEIKDGKAVYGIYLDSAENVNAVILKVLFDSAKVDKGEINSANDKFTSGTASASVFIPSYDVNSDGTVDIIDITEAQRYYQAKSTDANWETAKAMDVNGDNKVDIQDYIDIFNNLSDF